MRGALRVELIPQQYRRDTEKSGLLIVIGIGKLLKSIVLIGAAVAAHRLAKTNDIVGTVAQWAAYVHIPEDNTILMRLLNRLFSLNSKNLDLISAGTWVYAGLFATEGVGLLMRQRWAEWLTVVVTGLLVPFEIYEVANHTTVTRIVVLVLNVVVVVYLVYRLKSQAGKLREVTGMSTMQRNRQRLKSAIHRNS